MIRRIQITNDLLDVIKSCPSGVIDDIYKIEYYIQGCNTVYDAKFTKEGDCLKVVLPSSELEKLESGILMRRAYYKVSDSSYPDGYYNLTFEDNMNVWLGGESSDPYERQYVTDKELNETLEGYALKTEVPSLDGYATEQWVESKGYVTAETLPEGIATQSWVTNQGYITSIPDTFATKTWVSEQGYLTEHQDLTGYALKSEIPSLDGYATESWVSSQQFATQSWVTSQGYLTSTGLSGLATQSWVSSNFLSTNALNGYATESWVTNQGYITSIPDTFATKYWVTSQGYLTEHQDLSDYALKSEIPSLDGYVQETNLKTINDQFLIGEGNLNIQMPLVIEIDLDLGKYTGNYDDYMSLFANVYYNEGENRKVVVYLSSANLGIFYDSFPSDIKTIEEEDRVIVEVGGYYLDDRDENNKRLIYYRIKGNDATQKVEVSFTTIPSDADIPDLTGYATQEWVTNQGYITSVPDTFATKNWVQSQNYLTEHQSLEGYATQSWATSQFLEESKIWTGTQSDWDALTSSQKASYTIALITE